MIFFSNEIPWEIKGLFSVPINLVAFKLGNSRDTFVRVDSYTIYNLYTFSVRPYTSTYRYRCIYIYTYICIDVHICKAECKCISIDRCT